MSTRYVVINENTLGYIYSEAPQWMGVLHGSVYRNGHDETRGPVVLDVTDDVRDATAADFEAYRCLPPKGFLDQ